MVRDVVCGLVIVLLALFFYPRFGEIIVAQHQGRNEVLILAGGNVLFNGNTNELTQETATDPLIELKEILGKSRFFTFNLEGPLPDGLAPEAGTSQTKDVFTVWEKNVLIESGVDLVNLANDTNYRIKSYNETLNYLRNEKIKRTGLGKKKSTAYRPVLFKLEKIRLAVFGFNTFKPVSVQNTSLKPPRIARYSRRALRQIKRFDRKVDFVMVHLHWENIGHTSPTATQTHQAHRLIDAGADIVIGHHSGVLQPVEVYRGKIIAYNLGNFLLEGTDSKTQSAILCLTLYRNKALKWDVLPLTLQGGLPSTIPPGPEANLVMAKLKRRSTGKR